MATFTFYVKARVNFERLSLGDETWGMWHAGASSAMQSRGIDVKHAWKDTVDPVVYSIVEVEAEEQSDAEANLLDLLYSVPVGHEGDLIVEETRPVFPI